jgi:hypothetical protein
LQKPRPEDADVGAVTATGYTAVVCTAPDCRTPLLDELTADLRVAVRSSGSGVLVVAGCTLGAVVCRLRLPAPLVAVQPCDVQRRPIGPVVRVGPLRSRADVTELVRWLGRARFDVDALPDRLAVTHRAVGAATVN